MVVCGSARDVLNLVHQGIKIGNSQVAWISGEVAAFLSGGKRREETKWRGSR
jgi:hypothetical protein